MFNYFLKSFAKYLIFFVILFLAYTYIFNVKISYSNSIIIILIIISFKFIYNIYNSFFVRRNIYYNIAPKQKKGSGTKGYIINLFLQIIAGIIGAFFAILFDRIIPK
jgi:hypothetical protein